MVYPLPPPTILNDNVPPAPTEAVIVAAVPEKPDCDIPIDTGLLYPDPQLPVVPIPIDVIEPPAPIMAVTEAPTSGAYPRPGVDPNEIIIPPLGSWFILISEDEITTDPFDDVIPEKIILLIPVIVVYPGLVASPATNPEYSSGLI